MSKATFTFVRANPTTEPGHGKVISAVQAHAEKTGGKHYIFPSHSQDAKKNPLSHSEKVGFMRRLFPTANIISSGKVRTAIDAMKYLEHQGHTHATMVVGSDRVENFDSLLNKYRKKEFPKIKKVSVISAGDRDPDAEGAEGMSASKLRALVVAGKKKEFVSHYSDPKLGAEIYDRVKAAMNEQTIAPVGIFLLGGPGSGKDYLLKNIFSRFDLTEVQADQILNGAASELFESKQNIVINGANDAEKIEIVQNLLEGYVFDFVHVSVSNKVSRIRNEQREQPISESKRIDKFLKAEQLAEDVEAFIFNNSINLNESTEMEKVFFGSQIEKLLERVVDLGLEMKITSEPKSFTLIREKYFPPVAKDKESGLPKKYVRGLSPSTAKARKAHWEKMSKYSDRDPRAYEPAPGDATAKTKPSKHTIAVRKMMGEDHVEGDMKRPHSVESIADKHKVSVAEIMQALAVGKEVEKEHTNDEKTAETIALAHLWEKPDYYTQLAKMEQFTPKDHQEAEKRIQRERDRRDWRILHHQNRHIRQANKGSMSEAEDKPLPVKLRKEPRSGNITAVMDKRKETGRVSEETIDEGAADTSLAAKAKKSGIPLRTLKTVYRRGVAAWNSGHRPGTTPQQWGHARVNSYMTGGTTFHTADKDLHSGGKKVRKENAEDVEDLDALFEMQLVGTDEYRKHAIAMTPGQSQDIEDAYKSTQTDQDEEHTECGTPNCCGECQSNESEDASSRNGNGKSLRKSFRDLRTEAKKEKEEDTEVTAVFDPKLGDQRKAKNLKTPPRNIDSTLQGLPVASRFTAYESTVHPQEQPDFPTQKKSWMMAKSHKKVGGETLTATASHNEEVEKIDEISAKPPSRAKKFQHFLRKPVQIPGPKGGHPVPPGYERVHDVMSGGTVVRKIKESEELTLEEAIEYHVENNVPFTENVFRPGSEMFFEMIGEAKRLYGEGAYTPADEWEKDLLESDIGEIAEYEGQTVVLDYPIEEGLEECWTGYTQKGMKKKGDKMVPNCVPVSEDSDPTDGHGIGKPWRTGGGGAVYVRTGSGGVKKVNFSQSGMTKKFMDPAATRSFVARHHCLTNKDKTSASYWACRYPRFFSNSGKIWW